MSVIEIKLPIPEKKLPEHDTKEHPDGGAFNYSVTLADEITDKLLDEDLISVGKYEDGTYTSKFNWEGNRVERRERNIILKVPSERFEDVRDRISEIIYALHPYRTISATVSDPAAALFDGYKDWVLQAVGEQDNKPDGFQLEECVPGS